MAGDSRLTDREMPGQFVDARITRAKELDDATTSRIGQRCENRRQLIHGRSMHNHLYNLTVMKLLRHGKYVKQW